MEVEQNILDIIGMASMSPSIKRLTDDTAKAKAMHKRIAGILVTRMPVKAIEMHKINDSLLDDADSALEFIFNSANVEGVALTDEIVDAIVDMVARLHTNKEQLQGLDEILDGLNTKRT